MFLNFAKYFMVLATVLSVTRANTLERHLYKRSELFNFISNLNLNQNEISTIFAFVQDLIGDLDQGEVALVCKSVLNAIAVAGGEVNDPSRVTRIRRSTSTTPVASPMPIDDEMEGETGSPIQMNTPTSTTAGETTDTSASPTSYPEDIAEEGDGPGESDLPGEGPEGDGEGNLDGPGEGPEGDGEGTLDGTDLIEENPDDEVDVVSQANQPKVQFATLALVLSATLFYF